MRTASSRYTTSNIVTSKGGERYFALCVGSCVATSESIILYHNFPSIPPYTDINRFRKSKSLLLSRTRENSVTNMVFLSPTMLLVLMVSASSRAPTAAFQTRPNTSNRLSEVSSHQKQWARRAAEASFTKLFLSDSDDGVSAGVVFVK
jgi:hypothetical protein